MVKKGWLWLCLDMVVYLDGGAASVFPCVESVGGGEGADGFDGGSELRFCGVRKTQALSYQNAENNKFNKACGLMA